MVTMTCERCKAEEQKRFESTKEVGWDHECVCGWTTPVCEMPGAEAQIEARQRYEDWANEFAPAQSLDDAMAESWLRATNK
jgi:hypothetical protein